jgi:hypothetical protein
MAWDIWMNEERIIGKDLEGSLHGLIEILVRHFLGED